MTKLTTQDLDHLTAAMFVFIHAADRVVRELANGYSAIDQDTKEYKQLAKRYGKVAADEWLHKEEKKILLQAKGQMMHRWLEAANRLIAVTEQCTEVGLMSGHDGVNPCDLFDAMMNDTCFLLRVFFMIGNIAPEDYVRVDTTLKVMANKLHRPVSDSLLDRFKPNIKGL